MNSVGIPTESCSEEIDGAIVSTGKWTGIDEGIMEGRNDVVTTGAREGAALLVGDKLLLMEGLVVLITGLAVGARVRAPTVGLKEG